MSWDGDDNDLFQSGGYGQGTLFSLRSRRRTGSFLSLELAGRGAARLVHAGAGSSRSIYLAVPLYDFRWHHIAIRYAILEPSASGVCLVSEFKGSYLMIYRHLSKVMLLVTTCLVLNGNFVSRFFHFWELFFKVLKGIKPALLKFVVNITLWDPAATYSLLLLEVTANGQRNFAIEN